VGAEGTIQAGDIAGNGKLILSVRGNPQNNTGTVVDYILSVDIEQTLAQTSSETGLIYTRLDTTLTEMSWVAPIPGSPNLAFIRSKDKISMIDLTTGTLTSQPTEGWVVEKYSKIKDPHIVLRKTYDFHTSANVDVERRIFYVEGGALKSKALTKNFNFIINSHLDIKKGQWNVTKASVVKEYDLFNSYNGPSFEGRSFTRLRLNDLLSVIDVKIDNSATVDMAGDYLFSLFPSKMGYATKTDLETNKTTSMRNFNIKYLK
jgi:hypothetical protein